ncbi:PAS domain-containing protein [Halobaculum sp. MBLA0147]|uniref:PAS domain-containing protein n=1 Tax=Halobaculum sp. MBLA0147 TaxID=3079934 RepID=UPI00352478CF
MSDTGDDDHGTAEASRDATGDAVPERDGGDESSEFPRSDRSDATVDDPSADRGVDDPSADRGVDDPPGENLSHERAREAVYDALAADDLSFAATRARVLDVGRRLLGVENGHVERVDGETHEIVASVGGPPELLPEGERLPAGKTYCRRTLARDDPLAVSEASAEGWLDDPAYRHHEFECYLGATITVDGEQYGTVCFLSRSARETAFSTADESFVELVATCLGRALETERHEAVVDDEVATRERAQRLRDGLFEAAPEAILVVDDTDTVVEANAAATELTGYDEATLVGQNVIDLCPAAPADHRTALDAALDADGQRTSVGDTRLHVVRADGSEVPVAVSASAVTVEGTRYRQFYLHDVSDRLERREELALKDQVFDEVDVGVTVADAEHEDAPLEYVNDAFEEITGYDADDAVGLNCRFLQGEETDEDAVAAIRAALADDEPIRTELRNYRRDGTPFWNDLSITPITDDDGTVTHYAGIQRDVTRRVRRERLFRVLNRVLRHNLRNDLNVIRGYAETIRADVDDPLEPAVDRVVETATALIELGETARRLESLAGDRTEPRPVAVVDVVDAVAERLDAAHPDATVETRTRVDADAEVLATDRLADVIAELGENAITHTAAAPVAFEVVPSEDEAGVTVRVHDEGDGIPAQDRRVLTGRRETKLDHASSLGVWLVSWLVEEFGGEVTVTESADGTTVAVHLRGPTERDSPPDRHRDIDHLAVDDE